MNEETLIRRNIELWAQQYNSHDAQALSQWYANDSVYIAPTGIALVGSLQVRSYFEDSFKRSPTARITVTIEQVQVQTPDLIMARGRFEVTNAVDPAGKPLPMNGPWVTTFLLRNGQWIPLTHASAIALKMYAVAGR